MLRDVFKEMLDQAARREGVPEPRARRHRSGRRFIVSAVTAMGLLLIVLISVRRQSPTSLQLYVGFADRPAREALLISIRDEGDEHALLDHWNRWRSLVRRTTGEQVGDGRADRCDVCCR